MLEQRDLAALVTGIGVPLVGPVHEGVLLACRRHMPGVTAINPARLRQMLRDKPAAAYLMGLAPDARVQVGSPADANSSSNFASIPLAIVSYLGLLMWLSQGVSILLSSPRFPNSLSLLLILFAQPFVFKS